MTLPIGRGWLRRPSQPAPTTSSAPARAVGLGLAEQVGDELAGRLAGFLLGGLDAGGERRDPPFGGPGGGPGQLGRGLRPTPASGGGGVGEGHQPDRAVGTGGVVGRRPGPSGVGVDVLRRSRGARRAPAPSPRPRWPSARRPAGATTTASIGPGGLDHRAQRLGGVAEAAGRLDPVAGDGPGLRARRSATPPDRGGR